MYLVNWNVDRIVRVKFDLYTHDGRVVWVISRLHVVCQSRIVNMLVFFYGMS